VELISAIPSTSKVNQEVMIHGSSYSSLKEAGEWLLIIFAIGAIVMLVRLMLQYISLLKVKKNSTLLFRHNIAIFQVNQPIIPFSIGNSIFINQHLHNEEELKEIIRHEFIHVKQKHSIDILVGELLCILNWYNPFAWMIRKAIRINLEFITDNKVLESGLDKKEYQKLLLKVIGISQFSLSTPFNFSSLKKRVAMMNKKESAKVQLLRLLLLLPVLTVVLLAFRGAKNELPWQSPAKFTKVIYDTVPYEANDTVPNPPPPPGPPPPPPPPALPKDVKSINITEKKATVTLKNGKVENYDLSKPADRETFQKKYGEAMDRARDDQRRSQEMMLMDMKKRQEEEMQLRMGKMKELMELDGQRRNDEFDLKQKQKQEEIELLEKKIQSNVKENNEVNKQELERATKEMAELNEMRAQSGLEFQKEKEMQRREFMMAQKEYEMEMLQRKMEMSAEMNEQERNQQMEKNNMEKAMKALKENSITLQKEFEMSSKNLSKEEKQKMINELEMQQKALKQATEDLMRKQEEINMRIQELKKAQKAN
jgi:hypothetical protein